ncbi:adenylyltransferase/cytidyltransferase family protein [Deinococcus altitudinis]|uniref:adenylyltransferase/cytidyltransferase family protein n=1 Tax=Deinococcus altitudinis TaxID=468914 RepID=UPI0038929F82
MLAGGGFPETGVRNGDTPDTAVLIGRFQPPHRAHLALIRQALESAEKLVIVLGSARSARTVRNPLSDAERAGLIGEMLAGQEIDTGRVRLEAVPDFFYNLPLWVQAVRRAVGRGPVEAGRAVLHGFEKDASSFYLRLFPDWIFQPPDFRSDLNATDVREAMYGGDWGAVQRAVTPEVLAGLRGFADTPAFTELLADRGAIQALARRGPVRSVGVLLVAGSHMLLKRRTERPGLGLWAIPEGQDTWEAARRVTRLLSRSLLESEEFRSRVLNAAGRTPGLDWQTEVTLYTLPHRAPPGPGAEWVALSALQRAPKTFFADHAQGITALLEDWPV